jgi:iron-sulfur cluster repair protein YtfE (RIC family)
MGEINSYLSEDHRELDELFASLEEAVASGDAMVAYEKFYEDLTNHFSKEEIVLFPMLNDVASEANEMLRSLEMEHEQQREMLFKMRKALEKGDKDVFFALSETLLILMQQHNLKEESSIFTLADQHFGQEASYVIGRMRSVAY